VNYNSATDSYDTLMNIFTTRLTQWQNPALPINYYTTDWWISGYRLQPVQ
jgi:hypothetical protein